MTTDPAHRRLESTGEPWDEIDQLVEELARLGAGELSPAEFYASLLDRIVPVLAAVGGAVWAENPEAGLCIQYQANLPAGQLAGALDGERRHARLVQQVLEAGTARVVPPRSGPADDDRASNPTDFVLVLCPWRFEEHAAGVVELFQRPGTSPSAQRGYVEFLTVVCDVVADFHRNLQLRSFRQRMERFGRFEQFVRRIHTSLDLRTTAYHIANEGWPLIGCDRLSVAVARGSKYRLLAVSGVDDVNRRANAVRHLERLCRAVTVVGEPLWHPEQAGSLPSQIQQPLEDYLDVAHVRALAVIPLETADAEPDRERFESKMIGALVVEKFHGAFDDPLRETVSSVQGHCCAAIGNALEFQSVPLVRLLHALGKTRWLVEAKQLPKTVFALLALAAVVTALAIVPGDFEIEAPGALQPMVRRELFAPADGIVSDVKVKHGAQVDRGQILVEIRRPELDFEFKRLLGELQTARKGLRAVEAERLQNPRQNEEQRRRHGQLTAEEEELRERIASLQKQYAILENQQAELTIRSPVAGKVLTWDLTQLLEARPVSRGQTLMTVADLKGPWVLELRVPDNRVAHVLSAQRDIGTDLNVSYVLATSPGAKLGGTLQRIAVRTEVDESEEAFVPAKVNIDRDEIPELIPGATVVAKIHCGRRPIGYVWLYRLIEAIQMWILF